MTTHIHTCWACSQLFNCEKEHALNPNPGAGSLGTCDRCRRLDKQGKLIEAIGKGTLPVERITRERMLTSEEAALYEAIRDQVETEFPPDLGGGESGQAIQE